MVTYSTTVNVHTKKVNITDFATWICFIYLTDINYLMPTLTNQFILADGKCMFFVQILTWTIN